MWVTDVDIGGLRWETLNFGYLIPWNKTAPTLAGDLQCPIVAKDQFLPTRAPACIIFGDGVVDTLLRESIRNLALTFRAETYARSKLRFDTLGELSGGPPLLRAELKSRAHDAFRAEHDKGNRTLMRLPAMDLLGYNVGIISGAPSFRLTAPVYQPPAGRLSGAH